MRVKWTNEMDSKLLKAVIKKAKLTKKDHEELAKFMGDGVDAVSVRNHLYHLIGRKSDGETTPSSSPAKLRTASGISPGNGKGSTPRKPPSRSTAGKRRKYYDSDLDTDSDEVDDYTGCATPTPAKRANPEKDVTVKAENSGSDEEVV